MSSNNSKTTRIVEEQVTRYKNTDLLEISIDRGNLKRVLSDYRRSLRGACGIIGSLGIFMSVLLALITATFNEYLGIKAQAWEIFFTILCGLFGCIALISAIIYFKNREKLNVDYVIKNISGESN